MEKKPTCCNSTSAGAPATAADDAEAPLPPLPEAWHRFLAGTFDPAQLQPVHAAIRAAGSRGHSVFPARDNIFAALQLTAPEDVQVVILGQDPYHGPGQAHGLAFSVPDGVKFPPSLRNILKELGQDLGYPPPQSGSLVAWARHGVLLLNTVLTVEEGDPASHASLGWEQLTDRVIATLSAQRDNIAFILWGAHAGKKAALIDPSRHLVHCAPHPSPLSAHRGFFGSRPFSAVNQWRRAHKLPPVDWRLPTGS